MTTNSQTSTGTRKTTQIYVVRLRRLAKCAWCGGKMEKGEPVVRGLLRGKKMTIKRNWHLDKDGICCWAEQAKNYISKIPYKPRKKTGGRPKIVSDTNRSKRKSVQSIISRLKKDKLAYIRQGRWDLAEKTDAKVIQYMEQLQSLI